MKIIWLGTVLALDMSYGAKINGQRLHVMGADEFFAHMAVAGYPAYFRPGTREFRRAPRNVIRIGTDPIAIEAAPVKWRICEKLLSMSGFVSAGQESAMRLRTQFLRQGETGEGFFPTEERSC